MRQRDMIPRLNRFIRDEESFTIASPGDVEILSLHPTGEGCRIRLTVEGRECFEATALNAGELLDGLRRALGMWPLFSVNDIVGYL